MQFIIFTFLYLPGDGPDNKQCSLVKELQAEGAKMGSKRNESACCTGVDT